MELNLMVMKANHSYCIKTLPTRLQVGAYRVLLGFTGFPSMIVSINGVNVFVPAIGFGWVIGDVALGSASASAASGRPWRRKFHRFPFFCFFFLLYHPINRSNRERSRTSVVFFLSLGRPVPTRSLMGAHFVDRCWQMFFFYFFIFFWPELVRYVNRIAHRLLIDDPFLFACVLLLVSFTGFYWVLLGFAGPWTG